MNESMARAQPQKIHGLVSVFTVLLGPVAFLLDQQLSYAMVPWLCETKRRPLIFVPSAVSLALIVGGVALAQSRRRKAGQIPGERLRERERFVASAGVVMCLFSILLVLGLALAKGMFDPCAR